MDYISKIEGHPIKAECLKESPRLTNSTPYLYRPSYANGYGYETLIGGTVAVNQLVQNGAISFTSTNSDTRDIFALRIREISVPYTFFFLENLTAPKHIQTIINATASFTGLMLYHDGSQSNIVGYSDNDFNVVLGHKYLLNIDVTGADVQTVGGVSYDDFNIIDLTQMFGTTIADYVYTLETNTSGAGITWLKNNGFFGADYYPYNAGGLLSVKTSKKINRGKNLLNLEEREVITTGAWENTTPRSFNGNRVFIGMTMDNYFNPTLISSYAIESNRVSLEATGGGYGIAFDIKVKPNTAYYFSYLNQDINLIGFGFYDSNGYFISWAQGTTITTPNNCYYMTIVFRPPVNTPTTYNNPQLEFGNQATAYEPYVSHEYTLDDIELRGILKLDGLNNLYYDGDTYESNGSVTRKYKKIDFSEQTWDINIYSSRCWTNAPDIKLPDSAVTLANCLASKGYTQVPASETLTPNTYAILEQEPYKLIYFYYDGNTPTGDFLYELATPTTETADAFTNPMLVDGNGTEEFVDTRAVQMPVGHSTIYVDNSDKTKLDNLPDISDSGDGKYLIKQENGKQSLVTPNATDISYSNTSSGLTATKIQGAIDEVNTKVGTKANSSDVYTKSNTYNKTEVNSMLTLVKTANGNPCTFTTDLADALVSLTADVVCGQDLHGYDHPWAGGAGKNKLNYDAWKNTGVDGGTAVWENNGVTITANRNDAYTFWTSDVFPDGAKVAISEGETITLSWEETTNKEGLVYIFPNCGTEGLVVIDNAFAKKLSYTATAGVTFVSFRFGVGSQGDTIAYKNIQIEKGSQATPYEPYSNICPLVGHSELNLTRCGVNLWDETWDNCYWDENNQGVKVSSAQSFGCNSYIPIPKGGNIYFSAPNAVPNWFILFYDENKSFISYGRSAGNEVISVPNNAYYMTYYAYNSSYGTIYNNDISINYPSTDTEYHAYNGQTFTVAFGQTVYGGVYDKSGRLTITWGAVDLGSLEWSYNGSLQVFYTYIDNRNNVPEKKSGLENVKCAIYKTTTHEYTDMLDGEMRGTNESAGFNIKDLRYSDTVTFKTAVTGQMLAYELETPIVIDVPSISVFAENGTNNVFSDTGNTEVEYTKGSMAKDIKTIIGTTKFADLSDIPNPPTADGNYRLIVTITNGVPVYSWEEIT